MKYIKLSFNYLFKNFLYVFLLALIPAGFIGGVLRPFKIFNFMTSYAGVEVNSFGDIFYRLIDFNIGKILLTILGVAILALFVSLAIGQMENHMRSGKLNYKNMFQYVNNNILVVAFNLFILLAIWFVLQFLLSAIIFLIHIAISGIGEAPNVITIILTIIFCIAKFVLFMQIVLVMFLNIPNMLISGYPLKQATANSIKLINKNNFKLLLAVLLPFIVIIPLACALSGGWNYLTNILGVLIMFVYFSTLIMTSYFELSGTSRYDNRKYYNY